MVSTASFTTSPADRRLRVLRRATARPRRATTWRQASETASGAGSDGIGDGDVHDQLGAQRLDQVDGRFDHPVGGDAGSSATSASPSGRMPTTTGWPTM